MSRRARFVEYQLLFDDISPMSESEPVNQQDDYVDTRSLLFEDFYPCAIRAALTHMITPYFTCHALRFTRSSISIVSAEFIYVSHAYGELPNTRHSYANAPPSTKCANSHYFSYYRHHHLIMPATHAFRCHFAISSPRHGRRLRLSSPFACCPPSIIFRLSTVEQVGDDTRPRCHRLVFSLHYNIHMMSAQISPLPRGRLSSRYRA